MEWALLLIAHLQNHQRRYVSLKQITNTGAWLAVPSLRIIIFQFFLSWAREACEGETTANPKKMTLFAPLGVI